MNHLMTQNRQNYKVFEVIGRGGFAVAYKAQDLDTKEVCVIKKMNLSGFKDQDISNCLGEASRLKQLKSKYIIGFRDVFQFGTFLCIVMDFAENGTLQAIISARKR